MAIAILVGKDDAEKQAMQWFIDAWKQALHTLNPTLDIRVWPDIGNADDIDFALAWQPFHGALKQFKHLKAIHSLGAGVDHIFTDPDLNPHVPIVRIMDTYMASDIVQYVAAYVLHHVKRVTHWADKQKQKTWFKQPPFSFAEKNIGIMGLGYLGGKAATLLNQFDLNILGWSQSQKSLPDITQFVGDEQLPAFLAATDILICMLPLTAKTENILNLQTFSQLRHGAYIINVGRGQHLVEEDLLTALASGQLQGACLDVFRQEPLPVDHPFWTHPRIIVTPHIASVTNPTTAAPQVYENYLRAQSGQALLNQVDFYKRY